MSYATDIFTPGLSLGDRITRMRKAVADWRAANHAFRVTFDELNRLSDRELADLGISRSDIRDIAMQALQATR